MTAPDFRRQGILFVISAPSGTGKSTLCGNLRATPDFIYSVSCTTRPPRPGETDGTDYHFMTTEQFEARIKAGEMLEYAKVHQNYYGTLLAPVKEALAEGTDVLLDIDVQGASAIRSCGDALIRSSLVDVFIMPPPSTNSNVACASAAPRAKSRSACDSIAVARRCATGGSTATPSSAARWKRI